MEEGGEGMQAEEGRWCEGCVSGMFPCGGDVVEIREGSLCLYFILYDVV